LPLVRYPAAPRPGRLLTPEAYHRHALLRRYPMRDAFQSTVREAEQVIADALRDMQPGAVSFHDRTGRR